jgi:hypothetical protein
MSVKRNTIKYGAAAAVLALVVIAGSVFLVSNNFYSGSNKSTGTSTNTGKAGGSQGELDILLTDPPTVPEGVTAIYVAYSDVAVHVSGAGNQSGWTDVNVSSSINLMQLVNVSTTIAAVKVTTGVYNALHFNVSSAEVTYNGKNYTAFVPRAELTVIIPGGIQVGSTNASAALVDMHPTVFNMGSQSTPEFIVDTAASCFGVPAAAITKTMDHPGYRMPLNDTKWWVNFNEQYTSVIEITGANLTASSLSVTVKNTGTANVTISVISAIPLGYLCDTPMNATTTSTTSAPQKGAYRMPVCFTASAFFSVLSNGTLRSVSSLLNGGFTSQIKRGSRDANVFSDLGYELRTGQSYTFTFSGPITFGFSLPRLNPPGVISGDQYRITAAGQQALAQYIVVAS